MMNGLPPGSDPSFVFFLNYWLLAFAVICPVAWWAIARAEADWSVARRLLVGVVAAAVLGYGGSVYALEVPGDYCVTKCPYADWAMWWLLSCFLC
jgi:hypothetical protein